MSQDIYAKMNELSLKLSRNEITLEEYNRLMEELKQETIAQTEPPEYLPKPKPDKIRIYIPSSSVQDAAFKLVTAEYQRLLNRELLDEDAKKQMEEKLKKELQLKEDEAKDLSSFMTIEAKRKREEKEDKDVIQKWETEQLETWDDPIEKERQLKLQRAVALANQKIKPATLEYSDAPEVFISNIVDIEKGLIKDPKTGIVRKGTTAELAAESLKRQRIAHTPEVQALMNLQYSKDISGTYQYERAKLREKIRNYDDYEGNPDDLKKWKKELADLELKRKRYERKAQKTSKLFIDSTESGTLVETPLATGFRYLNMLPAIIAAELDPESSFFGRGEAGKSTEGYVRTKGDALDRSIVNFARGQGLGAMMQASPTITDVIGETGAFWLGTGVELFLPATPIGGASKVASGTLKTTAKGVQKAGKTGVASKIQAVAEPVQTLKLKTTMAKIDNINKKAGVELKPKEIVRQFQEETGELSAAAARKDLREVASENIAERLNTLSAVGDAKNIDEINTLSNKTTTAKLMQEVPETLSAEEKLLKIKETAKTKLDDLKQIVREEGAKGNTEFARLFNQADANNKFLRELLDTDPTKLDVKQLRSTPLSNRLIDEIGKVRLGREIAQAVQSSSNVADVTTDLNKLILDVVKEKDIATIIEAGERVIKEQAKETVMQVVPENLTHIAGRWVAPSENMTKRNLNEFKARMRERNRVFKNTGDNVVVVGDDTEDIISDVIEYVGGVDSARRSKTVKELIVKINNKTPMSYDEFQYVQDAITASESRDVLGAFDFRSGGEQFKRAITPKEAKQDVIAVTREREFMKQVRHGAYGQILGDAKIAVQSWLANTKATSKFFEMPTSKAVHNSDFILFQKRMESIRANIPSQFNDEFKKLVKEQSGNANERAIEAMNILMARTHKIKIDKRIAEVETINKVSFKGDWVEQMHLFQKQRYTRQMQNELLDANMTEPLSSDHFRSLMVNKIAGRKLTENNALKQVLSDIDEVKGKIIHKKEDLYDELIELEARKEHLIEALDIRLQPIVKEKVLDFELFESTVDEWATLITGYYGDTLLSGTTLANPKEALAFKEYINSNILGGIDGRGIFKSKSSNYLEVNMTNFLQVLDRIEVSIPALKGKGTGTMHITGKEPNRLYVPMDWMLGMREGDAMQKEMRAFLDTNPRYTTELLTDHSALSTMETQGVLREAYSKHLEELSTKISRKIIYRLQRDGIKSKNWRTVEQMIKQRLDNVLLEKGQGVYQETILDKIVSAHIDGLALTPAATRKKVAGRIIDMYGDASSSTVRSTIKPPLSSLRDSVMNEYLEGTISGIKFRTNDLFNIILEKELRHLQKEMKKGHKGITIDTKGLSQFVDKEVSSYTYDVLMNGLDAENAGRYLSNPSFSVADEALGSVRDFFRRQGVALDDEIITIKIPEYPNKITDTVMQDNPNLAFWTQGQSDAVNKALDILKEKKAGSTLSRLRAADEGTAKIIQSFVGNFFENGKRLMSGGMLTGFPIPRLAYQAQNIITAPLIQIMTVGSRRTASSSRRLLDALSINFAPRNKVMFVSDTGVEWTAGRLRDLEGKFNIGMTRHQMEIYQSTVGEVAKEVGVNVSLQGTRWDKVFGGFNPLYKTYAAKFADEADNTFRRAVFYDSLKKGEPLETAIALSQKSMLDYGSMSGLEKNIMNRFIPFWSFARQSTAETINSLHKIAMGNGSSQSLISIMRLQQRQHEAAGDARYEQDIARKRLWKVYKKDVDGLPMYGYGFSNPFVEGFEGTLNLMAMSIGLFKGEMTVPSLRPELEYFIDTIKEKEIRRVPPDIIYLAKSFGMWEAFSDYFIIQPVPQDERREQEPVFGEDEVQYEFIKGRGGSAKYKWWMFATLAVGIQSTLRDYTRAEMTTEDPEKMKRYAESNYLMYLMGFDRSLQTKDAQIELRRHGKRTEDELNRMRNAIK